MGNRRRARKSARSSRTAPSPGRQQQRSWVAWLVGAGAVVVVGLIVVLVVSDVTGNPQGRTEPPPGVEVVEVGDFRHTDQPVAYPTDPPAGGPHSAVPLECRVYDSPVRNENAVHSLEHGAVWIAYSPSLDADEIERIEDEFRRSSEVIISPYPGLDAAVVLTAWARQLRLDEVDIATIDQFVRAFRDSTAPEVRATC